jgi:pimeloyl-ACP methyl ester carboxylesterase
MNDVVSLPKNRTNVRSRFEPAWLLGGLRMGLRLLGKASPDVASAAAERLFRSPRRHGRPAWEHEVLATATRLRVPFGPDTLPAWSWGEGPIVLLVHGWEGRGSQLGAFVDPLVELGFRVVTFDAPGHGDSPSRHGTVVEIARAIRAVMAELGPVHAIVGHSIGCVAATYALSRSSSRSPKLVFVAPPVSPEPFLRSFKRALGLDEEVGRRMVERIEERYGVPFADLDAGALAPRMSAPLLVVHDRDDRDVPFEAGAALADLWPGARLRETRGLGHRRLLRAPEVVSDVVEFVTGIPRTMRTGLEQLTLDRELYVRDLRHAA